MQNNKINSLKSNVIKTRQYEPYLVKKENQIHRLDGNIKQNPLFQVFMTAVSPKDEQKEIIGRTDRFRERHWKPPFENDLKIWESGKRKRGDVLGPGVDMVEF